MLLAIFISLSLLLLFSIIRAFIVLDIRDLLEVLIKINLCCCLLHLCITDYEEIPLQYHFCWAGGKHQHDLIAIAQTGPELLDFFGPLWLFDVKIEDPTPPLNANTGSYKNAIIQLVIWLQGKTDELHWWSLMMIPHDVFSFSQMMLDWETAWIITDYW